MPRLVAEDITLSYGGTGAVVHDLTLRVPEGAVTSIIGRNGCGKSTLLRSLSRLMTPRKGAVLLDGESIHSQPTKEIARRLGLLAQSPTAPEAITVEDLARRGRYPHQSLLQPSSESDRAAVERALDLAGMTDLRHRAVDQLSGGQRQRAWIAMALAQDTSILLLDEPTTYLDIAHQQEVLALLLRLNREEGRTIVMVLHDVNSAAQVSDHVVAMRDGRIEAQGSPADILAPDQLENIFGVGCDLVIHPQNLMPVAVPRGKAPQYDGLPVGGGAFGLETEGLSVGYDRQAVAKDITVSFPAGRVSAIVGPNACGKSTLLRALARLMSPMEGEVFLGEFPIGRGSHRDLAAQLSILAQEASAPAGFLVNDLVFVGRYPYQRWYRQWSQEDEDAVSHALSATGISDLRWRPLESLSGGQRQRAWLAMALAQRTPALLLDEPTTFLDIAHQAETLELLKEMNRQEGRTIIMALHNLGQACRYADFIAVMKDGRIVATGSPGETIDAELVSDVFELDCVVVPDPESGKPLVLPPAPAQRDVPGARDAGVPLDAPAGEGRRNPRA